MTNRGILCFALCALALRGLSPAAGRGGEVRALLAELQAVGPGGAGSREAARAWDKLAAADAAQLPAFFEALDSANPLAANWIRSAIDAVAERQLRQGGSLPTAALERFLNQTDHAPKARRLAYEWLVRVDPTAEHRLMAGWLDDPSVELRRDAVAQLIRRGEELTSQSRSSDALAVYRRALAASRDLDQAELLAQRLKEQGDAPNLSRHFGFLVAWRVIGPFDNTDQSGFDVAYSPEKEPGFQKTHQGKKGTVAWLEHVTDQQYGLVDFNALLGEQKAVCAYAAAVFSSPVACPAQLRLQTGNAVKVWLNGAAVTAHNIYHAGDHFDQFVAEATLRAGENLVLVKVCQNAQTESWARNWQFRLRVCDAAGGAVLPAHRSDPEGENRRAAAGENR